MIFTSERAGGRVAKQPWFSVERDPDATSVGVKLYRMAHTAPSHKVRRILRATATIALKVGI